MTVDLSAGVLSESDARRLTERIRYTAMSVRDGVEKLQSLVAQAQEGQAHVALGYKSWTAYLADVMGDEPLVLARDQRRDVVAWLAGEGMSTRAIAPIVGVSKDTVARAIAGVSDETPAPQMSVTVVPEPRATESTADGAVTDDPASVVGSDPQDEVTVPSRVATAPSAEAPRPAVIGMDGKTYARPEAKPRRAALIDAIRPQAERIWNAAIELRGAVGDDRFTANRTSISEVVLPRVRAAALDLTAFLAELDLSPAAETEEARDRLAADLNHISETFARLARSLMEDQK
jgi:hypothetical protein